MSKAEAIMCGILGTSGLLSMFTITWVASTEPARGESPSKSHKIANVTTCIVASPYIVLTALFILMIAIIALPFQGVQWIYDHSPRPAQRVMDKLGILAASPVIGMMYLGCLLLTPTGILLTIAYLIAKAFYS